VDLRLLAEKLRVAGGLSTLSGRTGIAPILREAPGRKLWWNPCTSVSMSKSARPVSRPIASEWEHTRGTAREMAVRVAHI
jgi:hypothetical protein